MARLRYNALDVPALTGDIAAEAGPTAVTFSDPLREYGTTPIPDIVAPDYLPLYRAGEVVYLTAYDDTTLAGTISRAQEDSTAVAHTAADTATTPFKHGPTKEDQAAIQSTRVYRSAALSIASGGSGAYVGFDAEDHDDGGWHDLATNPDRIVVPAGLFLLQGCLSWLQAATGERQGQIHVNGAFRAVGRIAGTATTHATIHVQTVLRLSASDYVQLLGFQTSGANLAVNAGTGETWLAVTRLGD